MEKLSKIEREQLDALTPDYRTAQMNLQLVETANRKLPAHGSRRVGGVEMVRTPDRLMKALRKRVEDLRRKEASDG